MSAKPTLGELLLGIEGLALLRLAFGDDAEARSARVREIRDLLRRLDHEPELGAPLAAPEYELGEGYAVWSKTYDQPLRLFPIEHPTMRLLLDPLPPCFVLDAACGTRRYGQYLALRGHRVIGWIARRRCWPGPGGAGRAEDLVHDRAEHAHRHVLQ